MNDSNYIERFKALSDQLRLRIIRILSHTDDELCVCELVDILRRPQYAVSRALSVLRRAGLVHEERRRSAPYSPAPSNGSRGRFPTLPASPEATQRYAKKRGRYGT